MAWKSQHRSLDVGGGLPTAGTDRLTLARGEFLRLNLPIFWMGSANLLGWGK